MRDMASSYDLSEAELHFILFIYDYEFFTIDHASEAYFYSKAKIGRRLIYPLQNKGYIYQYYSKLKPNTHEDAMFDEGKFGYRVRYALSQKGRLIAQRFYRKLEGEEQINVPPMKK